MVLCDQLLSHILALSEFFFVFTYCHDYLSDFNVKKSDCSTKNTTTQFPKLIQLQDTEINKNAYESDHSEAERNIKSNETELLDLILQASAREGLQAMRTLYYVTEPELIRNEQLLQDNHPAALLSKFSNPEENTTRQEMAAFAMLSAAKAFRRNNFLSINLARKAHSQKISLRHTELEVMCRPREIPLCPISSKRYRTHDGTCNNQDRQRWGAALMPFHRLLPPEYGDGVDSIRNAADGGPLPSSRFISLLVHGAREGEASFTLMLAQWGQLLDHDMTSTAQPRPINGSIPSCCGGKNFHPSCFPIKVPFDDPWLSPLKIRCLEFLRSAPAQRADCELSWREQTNQASSFIDASPIYSSSIKASNSARTFHNGLLIFGNNNSFNDVCQRGALAPHCIRAGDARSSEQPGLLALHHVWVGEHNRIALELSKLNRHWSDEKVFQETRRIIGAMFQHITYNEFLPAILGRKILKLFDLELLQSGYYQGYDPDINPTVANEFSAAAFRFGHSLVQNSYIRCDRFHNVININVTLHEEFQRGDIGTAGSLHRLLRGMSNQKSLKRDEFITPELTNHLFQTPGKFLKNFPTEMKNTFFDSFQGFPFGLDLAAINIQRGRDHGLPPYTRWRIPCGLSPINNWDDFVISAGPESAQRIGHAYRSVHDIDLFVGGIAERPVSGALVGPTFACIIAQQFHNTRKGDRFWYENGNFESSFTPSQLQSLRRVLLANILCRAVGSGTFQPHIFLPPNLTNNVRLSCDFGPLAIIDLSPWLELDPFLPQAPTLSQLSSEFAEEVPERIFNIIPQQFQGQLPLRDNKNPIKKGNISKVRVNSTTLFEQIINNESKINDKLDFERRMLLSSEGRHKLNSNDTFQLSIAKSSTSSYNISDDLKNVATAFVKSKFIPEQSIDDGEPASKTYTTNFTENSPIVHGKEKTSKFEISHDNPVTIENIAASSCEVENACSIALRSANNDILSQQIYKKIKNAQDSTKKFIEEDTTDVFVNKGNEVQVIESKKVNESLQSVNILNKTKEFERELGFILSANSTQVSHDSKDHNKLLMITKSNPDPETHRKPKSKEQAKDKIIKMPLPTNSINTTLMSSSTVSHFSNIRKATLEGQNDYLRSYGGTVDSAADKGKEYEIQISIRQKEKNRIPIKTSQYDDRSTIYQTNRNDNYALSYVKRITTYATFFPPVTTEQLTNVQSPFTKPPIILIVDEGIHRTTPQTPAIFQNIANWNSEKHNSASSFSNKPNKDYIYNGFISNSAPFSTSSHMQTSGDIVLSETEDIDRFSSANSNENTIFSFNLKVNSDSGQLPRPIDTQKYGYGSTLKAWQTPAPIQTSNSNLKLPPQHHHASSPYSSSSSQVTYFKDKIIRSQSKNDLRSSNQNSFDSNKSPQLFKKLSIVNPTNHETFQHERVG
ncbi:uncharacterized protein ACN427_006840 isoform 1-T3 [Glossina fuscipes fuscipes]